MTRRVRSDAGFTLIEALVATALMVVVTAGIFTVLNPTQGLFQTQPEVSDMQQRLRVGVDTLKHDLMMAGAGAYNGSLVGSLNNYFAPVLPFVQSRTADDDGIGHVYSNRITIYYVPSTVSQSTTSADMASGASTLSVNAESNCPGGTVQCDITAGKVVAIYDASGAFDTFSVTAAGANGLTLQHTQQGTLSKAYKAGAKVVEIQQHIYWLNTTTRQLMHEDGLLPAVPVLDNIVGLNFEYYGDPNPPVFRKLNVDQTVTYGPQPPFISVANAPWPDGENCMWQVVNNVQVPRVTALAATSGLVQLTPSQLTDGPWCPDGASTNRYDADLLRIRKIRVTLRLQSGNDSLRAALARGQSALFANAGTSRNNARTVPDQTVRFDVSPRNMNFGR